MSQNIIADTLNQIMNAKKARKTEVVVNKHSKLLKKILDIAKQDGYLDYSIEGTKLTIKIIKLNEIKSINPRYTFSMNKLNRYIERFLPAKNFGFVIVSTNQGLMKHTEAKEKNLGGCLIAYVF